MADSRSSGDDPRSASNVALWRPPPTASGDEKPGDLYALCAIMMGVLGMMLKNKYCAWIAMFATLASIANTRRQDMDIKQIGFSLVFAVMTLSYQYVGLRPAAVAAAIMGK